VVEIDYKDKWQRTLIGIACIDERQKEIDMNFSKMINYISKERDIEVVDYSIEIF